jgi:hypothetical protein
MDGNGWVTAREMTAARDELARKFIDLEAENAALRERAEAAEHDCARAIGDKDRLEKRIEQLAAALRHIRQELEEGMSTRQGSRRVQAYIDALLAAQQPEGE